MTPIAAASTGSKISAAFFTLITAFTCVACFSFWFVGAFPGTWFSIRNAPTLRARRYLILNSLRVQLFLAFYLCAFFFGTNLITLLAPLTGAWKLFFWNQGVTLVVATIPWSIAAFLLLVPPFVYRKIVRSDTGLDTRKPLVPLEESPLSRERLQTTFRRVSNTMYVFFTLLLCNWCYDAYMVLSGKMNDPWEYLYGDSWFSVFAFFGTRCAIACLFYLIVFRKVHTYFLANAKDEEAFRETPPLLSEMTPYREKVFVEWLVYFGCFLIAGLIAAVLMSMCLVPFPYFPVGMFFLFAVLISGTYGLAALSARFTAFRLIINVVGSILLGTCAFWILAIGLRNRWTNYPLHDFLDSPNAWPIMYGFIILDVFILFVLAAVLVLSGLFYKNQWNGNIENARKFLSRKTIAMVSCVGLAAIPATAFFAQSYAKIRYFEARSFWCNNTQEYAYSSELLRLLDEKNPRYYFAFRNRIWTYWGTNDFDAIITDATKAMEICPVMNGGNYEYEIRRLFALRANAHLAKGEYDAAVTDFTDAIGLITSDPYIDDLYNRGAAYEKLGQYESAIADWDAVIKRLEADPSWGLKYSIMSTLLPEGFDEQTHRAEHRHLRYQISYEELKQIRDRMEKRRQE